MTKQIKSAGLSTVSLFCFLASLANQASAQDTAPGADPEAEDGDAPIVVTGSRIVNVGMEAPNPVTAVTADELEATRAVSIGGSESKAMPGSLTRFGPTKVKGEARSDQTGSSRMLWPPA